MNVSMQFRKYMHCRLLLPQQLTVCACTCIKERERENEGGGGKNQNPLSPIKMIIVSLEVRGLY